MTDLKLCAALTVLLLAGAGSSFAQSTDAYGEAPATQEAATPERNPDEMAAELNAQQSLEQTYTFTRRINGTVVETEKKTIKYSPNNTIRATEAGETALQTLSSTFDDQLLTRTEAFEEARLDFVVADVDGDGAMTVDEFGSLVLTWRDNDIVDADTPNAEIERQRRYVALLEAIDPEAADMQAETDARQKFAFMAGAASALSQKDYIREYLLDFDSMDQDNDMLLRGDELLLFRAANRGATLNM